MHPHPSGNAANSSATHNIKKTGKQSIGMSGRNRTATALLVASASASSEPLQESMNEHGVAGKTSVLNKNSNVSHSRKDHY